MILLERLCLSCLFYFILAVLNDEFLRTIVRALRSCCALYYHVGKSDKAFTTKHCQNINATCNVHTPQRTSISYDVSCQLEAEFKQKSQKSKP
jgi:hypothetical protein